MDHGAHSESAEPISHHPPCVHTHTLTDTQPHRYIKRRKRKTAQCCSWNIAAELSGPFHFMLVEREHPQCLWPHVKVFGSRLVLCFYKWQTSQHCSSSSNNRALVRRVAFSADAPDVTVTSVCKNLNRVWLKKKCSEIVKLSLVELLMKSSAACL